jgi:NADP-dependent 3-hydroxy acid dehydrogenase YdfG
MGLLDGKVAVITGAGSGTAKAVDGGWAAELA